MSGVVEGGVDALWRAQHLLRHGRYDECAQLCTALLAKNRMDMAAWFLKCRALSLETWVDDLEMEEETLGDALMDAHATAKNPRPGTSFNRPCTAKVGSRFSTAADGEGFQEAQTSGRQTGRPLTRSGRPPTGFARPGTATRPGTSRRPTTAAVRPGTASIVRMATAAQRSELSTDAVFQIASRDVCEFAKNPVCTRALCDFYLYHEHDPQKALELCLAVQQHGEVDWWWSARFGKCYYQLGLLQEAETHFKASLALQPMIPTHLEIAKISIKQDQPNGALACYETGLAVVPNDVDCLLGKARVQERLHDQVGATKTFTAILKQDGSNVEALACLAAYQYYDGEPHLALRSYRRILQMGVSNAEIWNNLGLCCLETGQYDLSLHCFQQALYLTSDSNAADVWYNIGHVGLTVGECEMAEQAFSTATRLEPAHSEALNNLGVIQRRRNDSVAAKLSFQRACAANEDLFEPWYNAGVEAYEKGRLQDAFANLTHALSICPDHNPSKHLIQILRTEFSQN